MEKLFPPDAHLNTLHFETSLVALKKGEFLTYRTWLSTLCKLHLITLRGFNNSTRLSPQINETTHSENDAKLFHNYQKSTFAISVINILCFHKPERSWFCYAYNIQTNDSMLMMNSSHRYSSLAKSSCLLIYNTTSLKLHLQQQHNEYVT